MTEHAEPSEAERTVLRAFIQAVTELANVSQAHVPLAVLADALHSAGAEILRQLYGPTVAAERLRQAADLIEPQNPTAKH